MKNKISKIIIAASAACYLLSSVSVYAAWTANSSTDNYLSMGSYKTSIEEEYTQPDHVDPSQEVSKIVNVKNSGSVGTFVRVAVEKHWRYRRRWKFYTGYRVRSGNDPDPIQ